MNIISSRRFLFQKTRYESDPKDSTNSTRVAIVEASIVVQPSIHPQIVPAWVADDELFETAVDDGTIIEVVAAKGKKAAPTMPIGVEGEIKSTAAPTPVAKFAGENGSEPKTDMTTGWGSTGLTNS